MLCCVRSLYVPVGTVNWPVLHVVSSISDINSVLFNLEIPIQQIFNIFWRKNSSKFEYFICTIND